MIEAGLNLYLLRLLVTPLGLSLGFSGVLGTRRRTTLAAFGIGAAYALTDLTLRGLPVLPPQSALQITAVLALAAAMASIFIDGSPLGPRAKLWLALIPAIIIGYYFPYRIGAFNLLASELMVRLMLAFTSFLLLIQSLGAIPLQGDDDPIPSWFALLVGALAVAAVAHLYGSRISIHALILASAIAGHRGAHLIGMGRAWSAGSQFVATVILCALCAGLFLTSGDLLSPVGLILMAQLVPRAILVMIDHKDMRYNRLVATVGTCVLSIGGVALL